MFKLLIGLLILSILLEGTITSLPLVFVSLVLLTVEVRSTDILFIAFISGLVLDIFTVRPLGETSVVFLIILFLVFLYERKYEIASSFFITIVLFFASGIYFFIFPTPNSLIQIVTASLLGLCLFNLLKIVKPKKEHTFSRI